MIANRRRTILASAFAAAGLASVVGAVVISFPLPVSSTYWWVWGGFAITFALLSYRSVEVNDRQLVSSAGMVLFAAAVVLSDRSYGADGYVPAVTAMTLMSAVGFLSAGDIGGRRVFRAGVNFGVMTVSGFLAGLTYDFIVQSPLGIALPDLDVVLVGSGFDSSVRLVSLAGVAMASLAAGAVYALFGHLAVRVAATVVYGSTSLVPWSQLVSLISTQILQGLIGGMLGLVLALAPSIALVPLVLTVFVVGHLVFTSQARLRSTHEAMLRGFVKILETRDLYTRGHTERVAEFALAIGRELGFSGTQLARMRWAALIHDVGKLAVPTPIMRKQGALTDEEYHEMRVSTHRVDDLLSEVDFLAPMVVICSGVHPRIGDEDFGQTSHVHSRVATREQSVLAIADAFDAMTSTRSYRMAMSQPTALARLASSNDPLFHPEVIEGLGRALARMSGSYGPPDLTVGESSDSDEVVRA